MATSNFHNVNASSIFAVQLEDTYEYDDLISNLTSEFNSHRDYSNHSKSDPNDLRSYPSTSIGGFSNSVIIGDDEVSVFVTPVIRSGYYDGCNLDYHILYYVNGYEDDFYEHYDDTFIQSLVYEYVDFIENVFSQYSTPLGVTAQFSNGETIYHPVNFQS
jgi:hypothetical protein